MASTQLVRTQETPTSTTKYTWSAWIKRGTLGSGQALVYNYLDSNNRGYVMLDTDDKLFFYDKYGGSEQTNVYATRRFKDTYAWYHIHIKADSSQASESDRFQVHINGVLETLSGSGSGTIISQNDTLGFAGASGCLVALASNADSVANCFDGIMSHIYYVDGLAIAHTEFGSTDSTTGEWKINTSPTISEYGNSGYLMLKDDNSLNDDSGKGNNFTASGTLTKTEDCPSNVFCTFNSILPDATGDGRLTNGNTTISCVDTTWISRFGTIGFRSGKYYWELKVEALNASNGYAGAGIQCLDNAFGSGVGTSGNTGTQFTSNTASAGFEIDYRGGANNNNMSGGSNLGDTGIDYSNGDILGFAVDMDNKALYMHKNGTYITVGGNVGVPTSGASKTGAIAIPTSVTTCSPAGAIYGANAIFNYNFGNGVFKTTAVSSAGTNASNIGIFEYDVPTGYTALSTKGLNE